MPIRQINIVIHIPSAEKRLSGQCDGGVRVRVHTSADMSQSAGGYIASDDKTEPTS